MKHLFQAIFGNPGQGLSIEKWEGWTIYNGRIFSFAFHKNCYVVMDHSDNYKFEYVYDWDGKYLGVKEEFIQESNFPDRYWFKLYTDVTLDYVKLYHVMDGKITEIEKFNADKISYGDEYIYAQNKEFFIMDVYGLAGLKRFKFYPNGKRRRA